MVFFAASAADAEDAARLAELRADTAESFALTSRFAATLRDSSALRAESKALLAELLAELAKSAAASFDADAADALCAASCAA
jgi:hypothetical protein